MQDEDVAIKVYGLHKSFRLPHEPHSGIKQLLINAAKGKKGYENQHVLKGLDFEIKKGEFFGIVGRNGSGKSTLLKLIAGIYTPDQGHIQVNGVLTPFIELGVGFNPELTGRENVFLNGALLGFSHKQMEKMYQEIVEFAELERFMDQKLKNYSSGMQVRLAFSVAIRARPDILLLDEVLAVGDSAFQQKCFDYFAELKKDKRTVILVSHSMPSVERFCDRALLLEAGEIVKIGRSSKVAELYEELFLNDDNRARETHGEDNGFAAGKITVNVSVVHEDKKVRALKPASDFAIRVRIKSHTNVDSLNVGINVRNKQDVIVLSTDTRRSIGDIQLNDGKLTTIEIGLKNYYTNGEYSVDLTLVDEGTVSDKILLQKRNIASFKVVGVREHIHSLFHPDIKIRVIKEK